MGEILIHRCLVQPGQFGLRGGAHRAAVRRPLHDLRIHISRTLRRDAHNTFRHPILLMAPLHHAARFGRLDLRRVRLQLCKTSFGNERRGSR